MQIELAPKVVYADAYLTVEIDEQVGYISLNWLQTPDKETFRRLFNMAATMAIEKGCQYWFSDARVIPYLDFADQNWVLREMVPFMLASQLRKYARLTTKQSIGLLDIHRISNSLPPESAGRFEVFTSKESALNWLFSDLDFPAYQES